MKFTGEQLLEIWREGGFEDANGEYQEVEIVEGEDDWQVEHKCEQSQIIFKYQDKYYAFWLTRWGNYWSGYEYDEPEDAYEVEQVEKTILVWKAV
jgi:hypothetical protein